MIANIAGRDKECYYDAVMNEYLRSRKKSFVRYDKEKRQYYIEVPEDVYKKEFPFIGHTRIRMNNPYTITFELNFIRMLRYQIKDNWDFDKDYDIGIKVADDNYIDKTIWPRWNSGFVKNLAVGIPDIAMAFAEYIINQYIEDFDSYYNVLTVKQVEFNKDYFVGHHRSADVLHQLMYFIISASGVEWITKLSGHAVSVYKAKERDHPSTHFYGDKYNPTLKFYVAKGIFFKIYRKTTDHIRLEITYQKGYIKRKFKRQRFEFVYEDLRKIAKDFFKKSDFKDVLKQSVDNSYSDHFSIIDNLYNFIDLTYPELSSIADSVTYLNPISDPDIIQFINGNKRLRNLFVRSYLGNGKRILMHDPAKAKSVRISKVKNRVVPEKFLIDLMHQYNVTYPNDHIVLDKDCKTLINGSADQDLVNSRYDLYVKLNYKKSFPYLYDFKSSVAVSYEDTLWFQRDLKKQNDFIKNMK